MPTTVQTVLREIGIARREQLVALRDQPDGPMRVEHINTEAELVDVVRLDGRSGARVYPGEMEGVHRSDVVRRLIEDGLEAEAGREP